jgi:hypothetical protein
MAKLSAEAVERAIDVLPDAAAAVRKMSREIGDTLHRVSGGGPNASETLRISDLNSLQEFWNYLPASLRSATLPLERVVPLDEGIRAVWSKDGHLGFSRKFGEFDIAAVFSAKMTPKGPSFGTGMFATKEKAEFTESVRMTVPPNSERDATIKAMWPDWSSVSSIIRTGGDGDHYYSLKLESGKVFTGLPAGLREFDFSISSMPWSSQAKALIHDHLVNHAQTLDATREGMKKAAAMLKDQ